MKKLNDCEENFRNLKRKMTSQKSGGILCEGTRLEQYRFIQDHGLAFGKRSLFRKFNISPNAYYNFLKDRKMGYCEQKAYVQRKIVEIYHVANGVPGYRMMCDLLTECGFLYCATTIYKYMIELGLRSIVRRKKPRCKSGHANKTFPDL